ncbi:MAG: 3-methyl-2-oxobutanoate hydroxymethyltransferase [Anaerolineales bacterium]|nr:3-methyl-2-oxobutanoate hydroxymethyltransferase [Anaerolineales bacterium]
MPTDLIRRKKVTTQTFRNKKQSNIPITVLTAYDYPTALQIDSAEIDAILVGDSLGMVVLGYENTLPVTMEDMLHHCKAVARGAKYALLIGDMPFMSYHVSAEQAVRNAGRFLQEAGMDTVKLEGGRARAQTIKAIVSAGIPVMGHIGLTPQSVNQFGGFRIQGKTAKAAKEIFLDAIALQEAGCYALVLESIPYKIAQFITKKLDIPTIGIGAGAYCDGQVLVTHDMLGMFDRFTPKFAKQYANLGQLMKDSFARYKQDVEKSEFPTLEYSYDITNDEWKKFLDLVE